MDLTNEEAQILLNMPKKIIEQDELKNQVIMRTLGRIIASSKINSRVTYMIKPIYNI